MLGLNKKIGGLMLCAGLLLAGGAAQSADIYPSKPVHILAPTPRAVRWTCSRARWARRWPRPGASSP